MEKDLAIAYQVKLVLSGSNDGIKTTGKVRIKKDDVKSGHKAGEVVTFTRYGTFGGWDEQNRWINFYNTEIL